MTLQFLSTGIEKFMKRVNFNGPIHEEIGTSCWLWTGPGRGGENRYGAFAMGYRSGMAAHRVSWVLANGDIPKGMEVCHSCDVTKCVRPGHLFLGTHKDNMDDMVRKGRTGKRNPPRGEKSNLCTRFNEEDVKEMRRLYAAGMLQKDIAKIFRTHQTTVSGIVRPNCNWKHIQ